MTWVQADRGQNQMKLTTKLFASLAIALTFEAHAIEPKALEDVDISALTNETQKMANAEGIHIVWWIPPEYWSASSMSEGRMSKDEREELEKIMGKYSLLAVAQGEISPIGSVTYYDRAVIRKGLKIELADGDKHKTLEPVEDVPENLQLMLKVMGPILEAALGNTGKNMNFFVLDDEVKGSRLISPYGNAVLTVNLLNRKGAALPPFVFEMPLDSLYVPRMCPNGKPAHVSWVVCPWDGTKLAK